MASQIRRASTLPVWHRHSCRCSSPFQASRNFDFWNSSAFLCVLCGKRPQKHKCATLG